MIKYSLWGFQNCNQCNNISFPNINKIQILKAPLHKYTDNGLSINPIAALQFSCPAPNPITV